MGYVDDNHDQEENLWSNLPRHILELILRRLCLKDYLHCRAVCRSWRTVVANAIATKHCPPASQLPLLLLEYITEDDDSVDPSFFSLTKQAVLHPKRQLYAATQHCVGAIEGWLMMMDHAFTNLEGQEHIQTQTEANSSPYFLFNPVSGERVVLQYDFCLPPQLEDQYHLFFGKMVASSAPTTQDCTVVGLAEDCTYFAFYRLANEQWNVIEADTAASKLFTDIEFHQGKLYIVIKQRMDSIMVYDLHTATNGLKPEVLVPLEPKPANYLPFPERRSHREGNIEHVVDSQVSLLVNESVSGELFLIVKLGDYAYDINTAAIVANVALVRKFVSQPRTKGFRVFKLDESSGAQWVEVNDLGDRSFFVSKRGNQVISSTSLNNADKELVKRNCIYYARDRQCPALTPSQQLNIWIFCLNDKSIQVLDPPLGGPLPATDFSCLWFTPSLG